MSQVKKITTIVTENNNSRIDRYLAERYPRISRKQWQDRINRNEVLLNSKSTSSAKRLKTNDIIEFQFLEQEEPSVNKNYQVVYETKNYLVIDKPANLPVHPSGPYCKNTLLNILSHDLQTQDLYILHRLDRVTSGLICIAKTKEAATNITAQFRNKLVVKKYYAIVHGSFASHYEAKGVIGTANSSVKKRQVYLDKQLHPPDDFKTCHTSLKKIRQTDLYSLLLVTLHSGRTHQIRATLQSLGFAIVGDLLYGHDEMAYLRFINDELTNEDHEKLILKRLALHCCRLSFVDPNTKKKVKFYSTLPATLAHLITNSPQANAKAIIDV